MTTDQDKQKEQHPLKWLLGFKETPSEAEATRKRKEKEARERALIDSAIRGAKVVKKVVDDSKKAVPPKK